MRQKSSNGGTLGADQFAALIHALRSRWGEQDQACQRPVPDKPFDWSKHAKRDRNGLVLFSGDLFNPSMESSITRGAHMVPVINAMQVDAAVLGNHDWDFGYPHLQRLLSKTNFPWLFSNVVDASWREANNDESHDDLDERDEQIETTLPYFVMDVRGVRIGCIGLVEKEWLDTVPGFPKEFEYRDMVQVAQNLSRELREGKEQCELILAITHCRLPNDIKIARALGAVSHTDPAQHGVDLILGGHDHVYYIGRGADTFSGDSFDQKISGSEDDNNSYIIKSGTDFHDLSEVKLTLSEPHDNAVRRRTIERLDVHRHVTSPEHASLPELRKMLDQLMSRISKSTEQPVALTMNEWDLRSNKVRTDESGIGDLIADILLISMERELRSQSEKEMDATVSAGGRMADCCIICGGSLRSDSVFGPGVITLGNLIEIMPFEDAIVVKELRGQDIWDALENGFSTYPKQEGRFPQVAGMQVIWDSRRPPGKRVVSVHLLKQPFDGANECSTHLRTKIRNMYKYSKDQESVDDDIVMVHREQPQIKEPLDLNKTYKVVTRDYLSQGNDGYEALTRGRYIVDDELGQLMSSIVRKFLLGATYIWRWNQLRTRRESASETLPSSPDTSMDSTASPVRQSRRASLFEHLFDKNAHDRSHLSLKTDSAVQRAYNLRLQRSKSMMLHADHNSASPSPKRRRSMSPNMLSRLAHYPLVVDHTSTSIRDALFVATHEHHSHFDTASRIDTSVVLEPGCSQEDLAVVMALIDGRMKDLARCESQTSA